MTVFFASAAVLLFTIGAVPVQFALMLRLGARTGFGAGISIFGGRFALKSADARALGIKKHLPWKRDALDLEQQQALKAAWHAGKYLARHVHPEHLECRGSIALSDAAQTALLCGCANSLGAALKPLLKDKVHLNLQPDFSAACSDALFCCIVSLRLGHIMFSALTGAWHYLTGRTAHGKASH